MKMDIEKLGIEIDAPDIEALTEKFNALAEAVERCASAIKGLDDIKHGGVEYAAIGDVVSCVVKPLN